MNDNEIVLFQTLVELREQLTSDFRGDYTVMKDLTDEVITKLLKKQLKADLKK